MKKRSTKTVHSAAQRASASGARSVAGRETTREVLSQPETWTETGQRLAEVGALGVIARSFLAAEPWLFIACGSSYYLARIIAAQWSKSLKIGCTALAASELLFATEEMLARTRVRQVVLISRSGKTTEVLRAAKFLSERQGMRTLGITCNPQSELANLCTHTVALPWADEKSMVMTRSFTSILLLFARLAADFRGEAGLAAAVESLPAKAKTWFERNADKIRAFGSKRKFGDFVFLGQGAHFWLAQEAALKMTEMSSSYAQAYHTLEFRHGPKAIASRDTLITFLVSDAAEYEERLLVGEVKTLGAATLVVTNRASASLRRESDLVVELDLDEPEFVRMALAAIPAQLLGLEVGLRKSLNPDKPQNLTRAVVLEADERKQARRRTA